MEVGELIKECEECGDEINPKRVKALPNAIYCVGCQQGLGVPLGCDPGHRL